MAHTEVQFSVPPVFAHLSQFKGLLEHVHTIHSQSLAGVPIGKEPRILHLKSKIVIFCPKIHA
jgi:hypothetical protein